MWCLRKCPRFQLKPCSARFLKWASAKLSNKEFKKEINT